MLEITKELETGIPIIDAQHRELVDHVNSLITLGEKSNTKEEMEKTLDFLGSYAVNHFKTEEDFMEACVYPACYLHKGQHKIFVDRFVMYKKTFEAEGYSVDLSKEIHKFIVNWLINHIKVNDKAFGEHYLKTVV